MALIAVLSAVVFIGKLVSVVIPGELVTFFLIVFAISLPLKNSLIISTIYTILEFLVWGIGPQIYIWTLIVIVSSLLKKIFKQNFILWSILSGLFGISFGFLCSIPYFFIGGKAMMISYWLAGIFPFDVIHMVVNFIAMLFLGEIVYKNLHILLKNYYNQY